MYKNIAIFVLILLLHQSKGKSFMKTPLLNEDYEVAVEWPKFIEYDIDPSQAEYIPENNAISGVKVYNDIFYVTVPRYLNGIPSTLNSVVEKDGKPLLRPYPSLEMQQIDNCDALQFVQSMEIDPTTGYMWIIDAGRRNLNEDVSVNNCAPKLVIWDINSNTEVTRHHFPAWVLDYSANYLNDIVIDPVTRKFAYMTDVGTGPETGKSGGLIVYDMEKNISWRLEHESMEVDQSATNITINNNTFVFNTAINGIALSPDGKDLFYNPLSSYNLFHVSTEPVLNNLPLDDYVRVVGSKVSQCGGMMFGHDNLYFGGLAFNAVYKWEAALDANNQGVVLGDAIMKTQTAVVQDDVNAVFQDSFGWDNNGNLYVTINKLAYFFNGLIDWDNLEEPVFKILKIKTSDSSYLLS